MSNKLEVFFSIRFNSEDQARIIFASLLPEIKEQRFDRSKVIISLKTQKMVIRVTAQDINAGKATIGSLLRWISAATKAVMTLSSDSPVPIDSGIRNKNIKYP
ncbi:MAG: KEOPS complex subunit Pcc1 [Candidatus Hodarchaeales archaeon]|jgi:tRNA threonylcarbamoyladenosine modification (KEOPS) complex  Pcc1 subunit